MRKKDREITDRAELIDLLRRNIVLRLGLCRDHMPYIVPLNYGMEEADGRLHLYLHSAAEGEKMDILRENPNVCFEIDCSHQILPGRNPGEYTMGYESVIGFGRVELLTDEAEKRHGLTMLMQAVAPHVLEPDFPDKLIQVTAVLRLEVESLTGKRFRPRRDPAPTARPGSPPGTPE